MRVEDVLALAERGWHVFPLRADDKRPAVKDWPNLATTDPGRITRAWGPGGPFERSGAGIACGPSRLVVVDLDTAKGEAPPEAWALPGIADGRDVLAALYERQGDTFPFGTAPLVLTGSGGLHVYYRATESRRVGNSAGRVAWRVDVRADGGYVVAPPSTATGRPYRWAGDSFSMEPAELPAWLTDLAAPVTSPTAPQDRTSLSHRWSDARGYGMAALQQEVERVERARPGTRNDTLHRAAFSLGTLAGSGQLASHAVELALMEAATDIGLSPAEASRTITSGLTAGMQRPRKAAS
uniref:Bifunctional DNA primase/polymerase n=1 Tax=Streptomyces sp. NBC_00003 TaxID=2903608 RepID=A0AAU2V6S8_9ACTN